MKLISLIILTMSASFSYATEQIQDTVLYEGEIYNMEPFILEQFFAQHPKLAPEQPAHTALWRGYTASFIITNSMLVLEGIDVSFKSDDANKTLKTSMFPKQEYPVMDWFTGILILGRGDTVPRSKLGGFRIPFANYTLLEVHKGEITQEKKLTEKQAKPFIDKQWDAYKKTDEYHKLLTKLKSNGYGDPEKDIGSYIILRDRIPKFYEE